MFHITRFYWKINLINFSRHLVLPYVYLNRQLSLMILFLIFLSFHFVSTHKSERLCKTRSYQFNEKNIFVNLFYTPNIHYSEEIFPPYNRDQHSSFICKKILDEWLLLVCLLLLSYDYVFNIILIVWNLTLISYINHTHKTN